MPGSDSRAKVLLNPSNAFLKGVDPAAPFVLPAAASPSMSSARSGDTGLMMK